MATIILIENSYDNFNRVILIIENILQCRQLQILFFC